MSAVAASVWGTWPGRYLEQLAISNTHGKIIGSTLMILIYSTIYSNIYSNIIYSNINDSTIYPTIYNNIYSTIVPTTIDDNI